MILQHPKTNLMKKNGNGENMTVLFDLDGTLLDTAPDFISVVNELHQEQGSAHVDPSFIRSAVSHGVKELLQVSFGVTPEEPHYDSLRQQLLSRYEQSYTRFVKPFPGIPELLSALEAKGIAWGVVTNRPSQSTEAILTYLGLRQRAACVVSGDTTPNPKPHPDPLFYACELLDVPANSCIYVGDAERDIQAGKAAGMATIGVLFGYIPDISSALKWGADHYVHHADEILPWALSWLKR